MVFCRHFSGIGLRFLRGQLNLLESGKMFEKLGSFKFSETILIKNSTKKNKKYAYVQTISALSKIRFFTLEYTQYAKKEYSRNKK